VETGSPTQSVKKDFGAKYSGFARLGSYVDGVPNVRMLILYHLSVE
jgi:hypothetical protein